jgi:hypothetical protein
MPNNDPQTIWQSQKTEEIKVSPAYFRLKADQQRTKNRWTSIATDFVYLATVVFVGFLFFRTSNATSRIGLAMLAAGSLYVIYRRHQKLWPGPGTPPDSGIEAYRHELLRWQADQRSAWWMVLPLLPGAIVSAIPVIPAIVRAASANPSIVLNAAPFCVLLAVWLVLVPVLRRRNLKKIQQELDALRS